MAVKHATPADTTFSDDGGTAWNENHTVEDNTLVAAKLSATAQNIVFGRSSASGGAGEEITIANLLTDRTLTRPLIAGDTWANRTNYQTTNFNLLRVTDIGVGGSIWIWDGSLWQPLNSSVSLLSAGIPTIIPSSGSIGDNGALSGIVAMPATFPSCFMYFPASAIVAGSAAGLYYVVMSSTTAGTIYNDTYTSGVPTAPTSPTAFVTTGPGAYTQTVGSDITLISFTVPGGAIGVGSQLNVTAMVNYPSNAGAKVFSSKYGGSNIRAVSSTTAQSYFYNHWLVNVAAALQGVFAGDVAVASSATAQTYLTVDSTANQTLTLTGRPIVAATDFVILTRPSVTLRR